MKMGILFSSLRREIGAPLGLGFGDVRCEIEDESGHCDHEDDTNKDREGAIHRCVAPASWPRELIRHALQEERMWWDLFSSSLSCLLDS